MTIPSHIRTFIALIIIGLAMPTTAISYYIVKKHSLSSIEQKLDYLQRFATEKTKKQTVNTLVKKKYNDTDDNYIDKHLETLVFLKNEIAALEKNIANDAFTNKTSAQKRLSFLLGTENKLLFSESSILSYNNIQETVETLKHHVEVDSENITTILSAIEGLSLDNTPIPPNKPQLIITDFSITKQHKPGRQETVLR